MKQYHLILIILLSFTLSSTAQDLILEAQTGKMRASLKEDNRSGTTKIVEPFRFVRTDAQDKGIVFLDLKQNVNVELLRNKADYIELAIPVDPTNEIQLELHKKDILGPDFVVRTSDGKVDDTFADRSVFYHGKVKGLEEGWATLSVFEGEVTVFISSDKGNLTVGKLTNEDTYVFYNESRIVPAQPLICGTSDDLPVGDLPEIPKNGSSMEKSMNCPVRIYIEVDYESYLEYNNVSTVETYITNVFNQVVAVYNQHSIPLQLSEIKVWTTPDPYGDSGSYVGGPNGNTNTALQLFAANVQSNFQGNLAHLVTIFTPPQGSYGGLAYLFQGNMGVLCTEYSYDAQNDNHFGPYGMSGVLDSYENFPTSSYSVSILSHEFGHNFGSVHTHQCNWGPNGDQAIDNCASVENGPCSIINDVNQIQNYQGTIMSYCNGGAAGSFQFYTGGAWDGPREVLQANYMAAVNNCLGNDCNGGGDPTCEGGGGGSTTISGGENDAEEGADGTMYITSTDLELVDDPGFSGNDQRVGMRFQNINIPEGAIITEAYIQFTVDEVSTDPANLSIALEDGNSAPFTANAFDLTSRSYLVTQVPWNNVPAWPTIGEAGSDQRTPDLSSIVQELVDLQSWSAGDAMTFLITGTGRRAAESFEGGGGLQSPRFVYSYECSGDGTCASPIVLDCGDNVSGNTADGEDNIQTHVIESSGIYTGPELIYEFTTSSSGVVDIQLTNLTGDVDLFLVTDCNDPANTSVGVSGEFNPITAPESISETLPAGTYYIIVDGYNGGQSSFDLALTCNGGGGSDCPIGRSVSSLPITSGLYQAQNTITSTGRVESGANVTFEAGQSITLMAGFVAESGSTFTARIQACQAANELAARSEEERPTVGATQMDIFPNPFQQQTTIQYQLDIATSVSLEVYDMNGRRIAQPVSSNLQDAGEYQVTFYADDQPKGIYLVFLRTDDAVISKRLVLIE